nr:PH domain-containing protein [Actinomycetales bacterium]
MAIMVAIAASVFDDIIQGFSEFGFPALWVVGIVVGVVLVGLLISFAYAYFAWRRTAFAVGEDAVYFHKGILFRSQRHARLNRIQGVDITRPLLGRLVGLSSLTIETAGGGDSKVVIEYLKDEDAERLRAEVLARAAGLKAVQSVGAPGSGGMAGVPGAPGGAPGGMGPDGQPLGPVGGDLGGAPVPPVFAQAPERLVYQLPAGQLILSILYSIWLILAVVVLIGSIVVPLGFGQPWGVFAILPVAFVVVSSVWVAFSGHFGHTMAISPDGLRLRHGLLSTQSQTIPPGRIQAVRLSQPFLWRRRDWWKVEINVAGYGAAGSSQDGSANVSRNVLLPVAPREVALRALWIVQRDIGVDNPQEVLAAAMTGTLDDAGFLPSPRSARWVDPVAWKRNGLFITRTAMLMRTGRITRQVTLVPHERTQSLAVAQGPIQRRLGVSSFEGHSVPGPILPRTKHLPEYVALQVLEEQAQRAREARAREAPEEWMLRVSAVTPAVEE